MAYPELRQLRFHSTADKKGYATKKDYADQAGAREAAARPLNRGQAGLSPEAIREQAVREQAVREQVILPRGNVHVERRLQSDEGETLVVDEEFAEPDMADAQVRPAVAFVIWDFQDPTTGP